MLLEGIMMKFVEDSKRVDGIVVADPVLLVEARLSLYLSDDHLEFLGHVLRAKVEILQLRVGLMIDASRIFCRLFHLF